MPAETMLTVADVAVRLALSDDAILLHIHAGRLAAVNVGLGTRPRWRIDPDALDQFLAARTAAPARCSKRRKRPSKSVTEFF